jgi:hypothetical protein
MEFAKKYADWEKAFEAAQKAFSSARDAKGREKASEEYNEDALLTG